MSLSTWVGTQQRDAGSAWNPAPASFVPGVLSNLDGIAHLRMSLEIGLDKLLSVPAGETETQRGKILLFPLLLSHSKVGARGWKPGLSPALE